MQRDKSKTKKRKGMEREEGDSHLNLLSTSKTGSPEQFNLE
jgi:hypothetical protein